MKAIRRKIITTALAFGCCASSLTVAGTAVPFVETVHAAPVTQESNSDFMRICFIDTGRKYFTVDEIKQLTDTLARQNYSHLELAVGTNGMRMLLDDMSMTVDGVTYSDADIRAGIEAGNAAFSGAGSFSQADMDEIISYARSKGMDVIPVLDTPGHMNAILTCMEQLGVQNASYKGSRNSIDLRNDKAVHFTQEMTKKYIDFFASRGCQYFHLGGDEYANDIYNSGFQALINDGAYNRYVSYINTLASAVTDSGMTPMAFSDGIYYNYNTSSGTFNTDIVVAYWTNGWGGFYPASASFLASKGLTITSTNESWYYVVGRAQSGDYNLNEAISGAERTPCTNILNTGDVDPAGCTICIWYDDVNVPYTQQEFQNITRLTGTFANANAAYFGLPSDTDGLHVYEADCTVTQDSGSGGFFTYKNRWYNETGSTFMNGTNIYSLASESGEALFTFYGNKAVIFGTLDPNHGNVEVYIDGVYTTTIDTNARKRNTGNMIYASDLLESGRHTIRMKCASKALGIEKALVYCDPGYVYEAPEVQQESVILSQSIPEYLQSDNLYAIVDGDAVPVPNTSGGKNLSIWSNYNAAQAGQLSATITFDYGNMYAGKTFDGIELYFYVDNYSTDMPGSVRLKNHATGEYINLTYDSSYGTKSRGNYIYSAFYRFDKATEISSMDLELTAKSGTKPKSGKKYSVALSEVIFSETQPVTDEPAEEEYVKSTDLDKLLENAQKKGFAYTFYGKDQKFDGNRVVQGTAQDMARLAGSKGGTLIVRYQTDADEDQVIFAAGNNYNKNGYGAILANNVSNVRKQRVDFPDGMYANLKDTNTNGGWHTFLYSVDASNLSNRNNCTVTSFDGSTSTQYPNYASWFNANSTISNMKFFNIGGAGGTLANTSNNQNFKGRIAFVAYVPDTYTQAEAATITSQTWKGDARTQTAQAVKLFENGDSTGSKFFRIPFMTTTEQGTVIAGADANFGSHGDSAENIDCAVRIRNSDGTWSAANVPDALHMKDYTDATGYRQQSASFIDGVIVEDSKISKRVYMVIDAWTWNGGLFSKMKVNAAGQAVGTTMRNIAYGDGFATIGGKKYLLLSSKNNVGGDNLNNNTKRADFNYAADIYGEKDKNGHYKIYKLSGTPRDYTGTTTDVDDSNLKLGALSEYTLNQEFELFKNGQALKVYQKSNDTTYTKTQVPMKTYYKDSALQMYNTSYLVQVYSDDQGKTWHTQTILNGMVKPSEASYFITGPGNGIQLKKGAHAGRLIVPVYCKTNGASGSSTRMIYSDDGGKTWATGSAIPCSQALSESAVIELPDGSVQAFARNTSGSGGKYITSFSTDGGVTWHDTTSVLGDNSQGVNCQISALRLPYEVEDPSNPGKKYPAVLMTAADDKSRTHGITRVGLIKENGKYSDGAKKYKIEWISEYDITESGVLFAYSCMTALPDGKIGILYETSPDSSWSTGLQAMYYKELTIEQLTDN